MAIIFHFVVFLPPLDCRFSFFISISVEMEHPTILGSTSPFMEIVCIVLLFATVKDMSNEYGHRERRVRRRTGGDSEDDQTSRDCKDE